MVPKNIPNRSSPHIRPQLLENSDPPLSQDTMVYQVREARARGPPSSRSPSTHIQPPCHHQGLTTMSLSDAMRSNSVPVARLPEYVTPESRFPDPTQTNMTMTTIAGQHSCIPFKRPLPRAQCLDPCAIYLDRYMIPIPNALFADKLPRPRKLRYLGVTGGHTDGQGSELM